MNKSPKSFLAAATAFLFSALVLQASISFIIGGGQLSDEDGIAAPTSTLFLLVADTTGDGFDSINGNSGQIQDASPLSVDSFIDGQGVVVVHRGDLVGGGGGGALMSQPTLNLGPDWDENHPLAILWFPAKNTSNTEAIVGSRYGFYTDTVGLDQSDLWITPSDGTSGYNLAFLTESFGGSNPDSAGNATLTVVPEPAAAGLLLGLGVLGFLVLRRCRK